MRFAELASACALALACGCGGSHAPGMDMAADLTSPRDLTTFDLWGTSPVDLLGADLSIVTTGSNVTPVVIDGGPAGNSFNEPFISITLCAPGSTTNCQTIDHVEIDTGSVGLHLMTGAINPTLLAALPISTSASTSQPLTECYSYASDVVYGTVRTGDFTISGETAAAMPFMVAADATYIGSVPSTCLATGEIDMNVEDLAANGVMGIGLFNPDCGSLCATAYSAQHLTNPIYYSCATPQTCTPVGVDPSVQLPNPVSSFAADNNGVIIELPVISDGGAESPTGSLVFGIGTQDNNKIDHETVFEASSVDGELGAVLTDFDAQGYNNSFFDSGSAELLFPSNIAQCGGQLQGLYCPTSTQYLTAIITGTNSKPGDEHFKVGNAESLFDSPTSVTAVDDLALDSTGMGLGIGAWDWGLPVFFGHRMFSAIQGATTPYGAGPYYAF